MSAAVLGLGANLGDARATLAAAVIAFETAPDVKVQGVSGLWRTAPVGGPEQPDFLNAVVVVETGLTPAELLARAQELESRAGRERDVRWGPRTLDVDVLDVAGETSDEPALLIPHPRAHERGFVLAPWAEVAPDWWLHPAGVAARTVDQWAAEVVGGTATEDLTRVEGGIWWR